MGKKEERTEVSPEKTVKLGMWGRHMVWKPLCIKCDYLGLIFTKCVPPTVVTYPQGAQDSCPGSQRRHEELFQEVRDVISCRVSLLGG